MTLTTFEPSLSTSWERRLFALAHTDVDQDPPRSKIETDAETLQEAYAACDALTKEHSKTFYTASALMPAEKRRAVRALYAFCRISDDLVDNADPNAPSTPIFTLSTNNTMRDASSTLDSPSGSNKLTSVGSS